MFKLLLCHLGIRCRRNLAFVLAISMFAGAGGIGFSADSTPADADKLWKEVLKSLQPPVPPPEWAGKNPTPEQLEQFRAEQRKSAGLAVEKLHEFYTRFPDDSRVSEAKLKEEKMQAIAAKLEAMAQAPAGKAPAKAKEEAPDSPPQSEADRAWVELSKSFEPPPQPEEWSRHEPSREEIAQFRSRLADFAARAADRAQAFYAKYPEHKKAMEARWREYGFLSDAFDYGKKDVAKHLEEVEERLLKDAKLNDDERFAVRQKRAERRAFAHDSEGIAAVMRAFEKEIRGIQKDFPNRPETYQLLMMIASNSDAANARALYNEIVAASIPDELKEQARESLKQLERVGQPFELEFTALDERPVDMKKLRGKVVLVDFWATWCGPCMAALPEVLTVYQRHHPEGFEIVGINLDQNKETLLGVLKEKNMTWPQHFDGLVWQSDLVQRFGVHAIPSMWLVDKKGMLRDINARQDLDQKVSRLLAE